MTADTSTPPRTATTYQLTVDTTDAISVTDHPDREAAHAHLVRRVVTGDYYLRTVHIGPAHTTYELLSVSPGHRHPRSAGHAAIVAVTHAPRPAVVAEAAQRWITRHATGLAGLPGPAAAVLSMARADAGGWLDSGLLLPEAARLAGLTAVSPPSRPSLDALRRAVIAHPDLNPEQLADLVCAHLEASTAAAGVTATIWWCALLAWGADAP